MSDNDLVSRARGEAFVGRRDELAQLASAGAEVAGPVYYRQYASFTSPTTTTTTAPGGAPAL